jgi:hypothetical protein
MIASANPGGPRFSLGRCLATPGAIKAMNEAGQTPASFIDRHVRGDWGDADPDDRHSNEDALLTGARVWSVYRTSKGVKLWVITEADRSTTTILLPEEY